MRRSVLVVVAALVGSAGACGTLLAVDPDGPGGPGPGPDGGGGDGTTSSDGASSDGASGDGTSIDSGCDSSASDPLNCGTCGRKCNAGGTCDAGKCDRRVVFVTNQTFSGAGFGGKAADVRCEQFARAAGLGGTYRAWLSVAGDPNRFQPPNAVPYYNTAGWLVHDGWPPGDTLNAPIEFDERGKAPTSTSSVWTNLNGQGAPVGASCSGWTSVSTGMVGDFGSASATDAGWTATGSTSECSDPLHLYCVEWP